jgi:hypothetical protein
MPIIGSAIDFRGDFAAYSDNLFVSLMFVLIAIGVGFFIIAGVKDSKWNYIKQESCYIDYSTAEYIRNEKERFSVLHAIMLVIGIIMCIISVIPPIMTSSIKFIVGGVNIEELSAAGMFCIVGVGVFFIVVASTLSGRYDKLLKLVNSQGIPGSANDKDEVHYENKTLALIMSLYWPTVTSIYLIWSFVTFKWYITWIIWPIAGIINKVIESNLGTKNDSGYSNDYRGNTTAYRVILTIITVGLIIFGVFGRFSFHFPFGINIGGFLGSKTVTKDIAVNDFENITLDMSIGDVTIEHGDSYKIRYSFPETMLPDIESKDGMLTVSTKDGKAGLLDFFGHKNGTMTITIPENDSLQSIHADLNMGNIKFSEIDIAGSLELDADMGNIEIMDSDIGTAKCEADMGNIELTKIKAKEVTLDADMGNIEISGTVSSLTSECSMGSIRFDPDNEITDEHISLKTDMGSVKVGGTDYGRSFNNH